jgi:hypothetical protein
MGVLLQPSLTSTGVSEAGPYARAMTLPVAPAIATEISLAYHIILEALNCGHGNEAHLASMLQMTIKTVLLGERSCVKLNEHVFDDARDGIVTCRRAGLRTGSWRLDPSGYKALCKVLVAYERQLAVTPFYEYMLVHEDVNEWIVGRRSREKP